MKKWERIYANPSAIHKSGVFARALINDSRAKIAQLLNAHSDEIIFTGSGTQSDALAILGVVKLFEGQKPHIVTTNIEHSAVLENCKMLEREGKAEVTYVEVEQNGIVDPKKIRNAIKENTVLVSVMYANNEIGTIQPIQEIAKIIRNIRKEKKLQVLPGTGKTCNFPLFHTDACQAMNYLFTENVDKLGVDLLSFNGSKIYGPKGVGVLYKKRNVELAPVYTGGGQEFGLRSGTENTTGICGVAEALRMAFKIKAKESARLTSIREYTIEKILNLSKKTGYQIVLNGDQAERLPNNINISITGISSELLVIELDAKGIEVSQKSACKANGENNDNTLRVTMGRSTKKIHMDIFVSELENILLKYKKWK